MNVSDNICNLECVKDDNIHEFVGPVKIIFVKPSKREYFRNQICAACVSIANLILGATFALVILWTLHFVLPLYNNLHIALCTLGGQLFMPLGILMINGRFGPSAPLKKTGRRYQHLFFQILAILCLAGGSTIVLVIDKRLIIDSYFQLSSFTPHMISGCLCSIMPIISAVFGFCALLRKSEMNSRGFFVTFHMIWGSISFLSSSVCFITGVIKPIVYAWGGNDLPIILSVFCGFYTIVILYTPLTRCINKK